MNVLDEDVIFSQRRLLESFKIHFRQIGVEIGRSGMKDLNEVIPLLHQLKFPTFFTLDHGFYHPRLRHPAYCLVHLDVPDDEAAQYIRRFLSHAYFRTQTQRIGNVVRAHHNGLNYWRAGSEREHKITWE